MNGQDIWTVIIKSNSTNEMSTVSFKSADSAIDCVLSELADALELKEGEYDNVRDELEDQMYYESEGATYWIEEAKLF